ncbi:Major facilitator superfamily domain general substrate transporter [Penicillium chrysogenum]|uniref:Major facilitator superfamily domain general substrate transporter n=1 Tax=Penicillium chrysogenum TaxID=5076 RepID=A0ABQ8W5J0_PENCH|nr:Major facilitator superfamily domain general substrate transporter [Penicillium chrysogenum]KAJ5236546.1 Major facilitator superfamily domain general substrate transporter [Penicillium chrysogenum]KAJ5255450.1 Major facilitator superfamily domain general substrate transporter [Penicillium chrysogenum]KAJ5276489.1 Major facilitator superfamily domain general substrate transporter [Penicillium chrysogenum]KAJ6152744.1 Major facilitator superfamily domain general substrate transporter [Penicill
MADGSFVAATNEEGDWESLPKIGFPRLGPWLTSCYNFGYSVALPVYAHLCAGNIIVNANVDSSEVLTGIGVSGLVDVISSLLNDLVSPSEVAVLRSYLSVASTLGISSGDPIGP